MTWVKLDDGFTSHPKTLQISHKAIVLHIAGLCYCSAQLTDGTITQAAIPRLLGEARCTKRQVTELVEAGMWHTQGKDFLIHDYLEYQESREKVLNRRDAAAERKRKSRGESQRDGLCDSQRPSHDTRPDPTRPDPLVVGDSALHSSKRGATPDRYQIGDPVDKSIDTVIHDLADRFKAS